MITVGLFFVIFGVVILFFPQLLAYMIAFFFIIVGVNILVFGARLSRVKKESSFRFGGYDISRRNK